ncbi:MAG: TIGR01777 family oxidoreductase [Pirellulaceae bacterium]|jgi:uncharacterized protein (TIGR01777 family)
MSTGPIRRTVFRSLLPVSREAAFAYHEWPGALGRLLPPWQSVTATPPTNGLKDGSQVRLTLRMLGIPLHWLAVHEGYNPPELFVDTQASGPFAFWRHEHHFQEGPTAGTSILEDQIAYRLPLAFASHPLAGRWVDRQLASMFAYRHRITQSDLLRQSQLAVHRGKRVAVTGATGLIGSIVCQLLESIGCYVIPVVRTGGATARVDTTRDTLRWDPARGLLDPAKASGLDAIIHLAGKSLASGRWTVRSKEQMWSSRVDATQLLANQLAGLAEPPKSFVSASGVGIYGDCADRWCAEDAPPAEDYLGRMAFQWEAASEPLRKRGVRIAQGRLGIVLSPQGGALHAMLPIFRLGLGGPLGAGDQYWSWVERSDAAAAFVHLALEPGCEGPYNISAETPETNRRWTQAIGKAVGRPAILPAPAFALRCAMGTEMANSMLLSSTRADGARLRLAGFQYAFSGLAETLNYCLGSARFPTP